MRKFFLVVCGIWVWTSGGMGVVADSAYIVAKEKRIRLKEQKKKLDEKSEKIAHKKKLADLDAQITGQMIRRTSEPSQKKSLLSAQKAQREQALMFSEKKKQIEAKKKVLNEEIKDEEEKLKALSGGHLRFVDKSDRFEKIRVVNHRDKGREAIEKHRIRVREKMLEALKSS